MINLFTYGTLRVGQYNYRWASGDVVDEICDVTTSGDLYFVNERGGYPVAKLDGTGSIVGDVLVYPEQSSDWKHIYDMESHSGYELREVEVFVETPDCVPLVIPAVAWHYMHDPRGSKIEDGDWVRAIEISENA